MATKKRRRLAGLVFAIIVAARVECIRAAPPPPDFTLQTVAVGDYAHFG